MIYYFTTLAINEPYFKKSLEFYISLHDRTRSGFFNITTSKNDLERLEENINLSYDELKLKYPRLQITLIEDLNRRFTYPLEMEGYGFIFNLNLKVLSIKACLMSKVKFDYLIFCDGDWDIHDGFDEKKLINMFNFMDSENIDFAFERPAKIGNYKSNNYENCFFLEKIYDYGVDKHTLWDDAEVVNEQFLAFKNNEKLMVFQQKWEQMLWYTIANNIRNYPDGFEIGVSALESKMVHSLQPFSFLTNCFYFYPKYSDIKHIRF
jgi:hypothetical protein